MQDIGNEAFTRERPYEKCEALGPVALSDSELLAVVLRTGSRSRDVYELSDALLERAGGRLRGLPSLTYEELISMEGIGRVKALQILCIMQIVKRIWRETAVTGAPVLTAEDAARYYMQDLRFEDTEQVHVLMLDTKMRRIKDHLASKGSVNMSAVPVREIIRESLICNAVNIVLVHNHPSGDPAPSSSDLETAGMLRQACGMAGIRLVDSIIIGDGIYYSFKEEGHLF